MATAEYVLESLAAVENHLSLLSAANGAREIVDAVGKYLESWSKDRIESLQKIDGGWGAFDNQLRPEPFNTPADIALTSDALSNHCRALKEAGLEPTPELLELNLYFALAKQIAERFVLAKPHLPFAARSTRDNRRWTERHGLGGFSGNGLAGF